MGGKKVDYKNYATRTGRKIMFIVFMVVLVAWVTILTHMKYMF